MTHIGELPDRVLAFVRAETPALEGARVVLAVSGGGDSCAMASLLAERGVMARDSVIAHFDHRLRSVEESARERATVDALGAALRMRIVHGEWRDPAPGEAAAREARYAFLRSVASDAGATGAVTGHTSDDQAETVLLRIARGAGVRGLGGVRPEGPWHGDASLRLWRPLLSVSREETRAWCAGRGIAVHDDPSNDDRAYARNRVRLDLLPAIERHDPDARASLAALADHARRLSDAMDAAALEAVAPISLDEGVVRLSRDALRAAPVELLPPIFRLALMCLPGDARDVGRVHYEAFARAALGRTGAMYEFPRGVIVTVDADELLFSRGIPTQERIAADFEAALPFSGRVGAWEVEIARARTSAPGVLLAPAVAVLRGRRPGDRVNTRAGRHRKLQDVLVDRKVPRRLRDAMPVVASGDAVLWTPYDLPVATSPGIPYAVSARRCAGA